MEDRRCKLGLQGRLELVTLIEQGSTLRAAAAALSVAPATAHRWWHRWCNASPADRASRVCLRTRSSRPGSCPWALSSEDEQAILRAREKTNRGPMQLAFSDRSAPLDDLEGVHRHGVSRQRRSERSQTTRRYEWTEAGALLHIDAFELPKFDRPGHWAHGDRSEPIARATSARSRSLASSTITPAWPTARSTPPRTRTTSRRPCCAPASWSSPVSVGTG